MIRLTAVMTNCDNTLLQLAIGTLLQITTRAITIYGRYYNSRQLQLQFTTGITIHDSLQTLVCERLKMEL